MSIANYLTIQGELISETRNGDDLDYILDPVGSTAKLASRSGITDTYNWWPYGEQRTHVGESSTPFGFVGAFGYCADSWGGIYIRARSLKPNLSQWQTVDATWPTEKAYVYVYSDPINYSDPSGNAGCSNPCDKLHLPHGVTKTLCPCTICHTPYPGDPPGLFSCIVQHENVHCHQYKTHTATVFCKDGLLNNTNQSAAECPALLPQLRCLLNSFGGTGQICANNLSPQCQEVRQICSYLNGTLGYPPNNIPLKCPPLPPQWAKFCANHKWP